MLERFGRPIRVANLHVLPFSADMNAGGPVERGFVRPDAGSSSSWLRSTLSWGEDLAISDK